jgi:hypothetical protein
MWEIINVYATDIGGHEECRYGKIISRPIFPLIPFTQFQHYSYQRLPISITIVIFDTLIRSNMVILGPHQTANTKLIFSLLIATDPVSYSDHQKQLLAHLTFCGVPPPSEVPSKLQPVAETPNAEEHLTAMPALSRALHTSHSLLTTTEDERTFSCRRLFYLDSFCSYPLDWSRICCHDPGDLYAVGLRIVGHRIFRHAFSRPHSTRR